MKKNVTENTRLDRSFDQTLQLLDEKCISVSESIQDMQKGHRRLLTAEQGGWLLTSSSDRGRESETSCNNSQKGVNITIYTLIYIPRP